MFDMVNYTLLVSICQGYSSGNDKEFGLNRYLYRYAILDRLV